MDELEDLPCSTPRDDIVSIRACVVISSSTSKLDLQDFFLKVPETIS